MPLEFMCGFEGISTSELTSGGVRFNYAGLGGAGMGVDTTASLVRSGLRALRCGAEVNRKGMVNAATRVVGFGFNHDTGDAFPADSPMIVLTDGGTAGNAVQNETGISQISLALANTGALCVFRGFTTAKLGSNSTQVLQKGVYYFIEFVSTIADAPDGSFEVWVDGVQWLSMTGQDTKNTANAYSNGLCIRGPQSAQTWTCDDVYVIRDSTTRYGPGFRIIGLMPSGGNGANDTWDKSTGTDTSALLDEIGPNTSDWVSSSTVDEIVTVPMQPVGLTGTVVGVQTYLHVSKTDVGARSICPVQRIGSTNHDGSTIVLAQGFTQTTELRETKPAGGAYTVADIDGMEVGAKVVA